MRRVCFAFSLTLLLAIAGLGVAGAEDLTIISQVTPAKGKPTTSSQYITKDKSVWATVSSTPSSILRPEKWSRSTTRKKSHLSMSDSMALRTTAQWESAR